MLLALVGAVLVVATFAYLLPTIADYGDVWRVVKGLSWEWIAALVAVTAVNLVTFAPPWLALLPGLRFWPALMMTQATTALSIVVPGGAAVGIATSYGMLRRSGFASRDVARSLTLVSLWNQLANLAYPIVAVFLLTIAGEETTVLATVAFVGVAVLGVVVAALVLVLYSNRMAGEIGDLAAQAATGIKARFNREPVPWSGGSFERFRVGVVDILKRRWHLLTLATLAGSLSVFVVLLVSLRAGGTGLNLTAASRVVHYDRWWNPALEDQATDRAWRIGQHRAVFVHKLVCQGTIEERVDAMINDKRALADAVVGTTGETWLSELSTDELRDLIVLDHHAVRGM